MYVYTLKSGERNDRQLGAVTLTQFFLQTTTNLKHSYGIYKSEMRRTDGRSGNILNISFFFSF